MLPVVVSFFPLFFWEPFPNVIQFNVIRALYGENTDKILVHVQSVIDLFAKQLNNALNLHYVYHQNTGVIRAIFHKCP
jgi:hypothetical protein